MYKIVVFFIKKVIIVRNVIKILYNRQKKDMFVVNVQELLPLETLVISPILLWIRF